MISRIWSGSISRCVVVLAMAFGAGCAASSKSTTGQQSTVTASTSAPRPAINQQTFATPEAAVTALQKACESNDTSTLLGMFGSEGTELIDSGDPATDRVARETFAELMREKNRLMPMPNDRMELVVGKTNWPFPIPLVRDASKNGWRWDTEAGADEVLNRRIGRNELAAIEICKAYVAAQAEYSRLDRDGDQVLEYAQRVLSTPGRKDGLYWDRQSEDELPSPLDLLASISEELFPERQEGDPLVGYNFRIINKQGDNVPGGKYDYVINGNMIAGFAMVAWPAEYGNSGIMTFLVNHQGKVLQRDLGEKTESIASSMKSYDPDQQWVEAE